MSDERMAPSTLAADRAVEQDPARRAATTRLGLTGKGSANRPAPDHLVRRSADRMARGARAIGIRALFATPLDCSRRRRLIASGDLPDPHHREHDPDHHCFALGGAIADRSASRWEASLVGVSSGLHQFFRYPRPLAGHAGDDSSGSGSVEGVPHHVRDRVHRHDQHPGGRRVDSGGEAPRRPFGASQRQCSSTSLPASVPFIGMRIAMGAAFDDRGRRDGGRQSGLSYSLQLASLHADGRDLRRDVTLGLWGS